ncbi:hypothetical protein HIM_00230 [Hirsutella minnesotensis 3608]|nr:hypothetical protein HIM_00230 [Hirsutella minnesotensis 3608]
MPRKKKANREGEAPLAYTESEQRFIKVLFDNLITKPVADWDRIAEALGLKDAKCAKERYRQMSNRHKWGEKTSKAPAAAADKPVVKEERVAHGRVTKSRATRQPAAKRGVARIKSEEEDDVDSDEQEVTSSEEA